MVRKHYQAQYRFDSSPVANVALNLECRDEIIPILFGLQYLYTNATLRRKVVQLVAVDSGLRLSQFSGLAEGGC